MTDATIDGLPPLPELLKKQITSVFFGEEKFTTTSDGYTADQMRAYALEAVRLAAGAGEVSDAEIQAALRSGSVLTNGQAWDMVPAVRALIERTQQPSGDKP